MPLPLRTPITTFPIKSTNFPEDPEIGANRLGQFLACEDSQVCHKADALTHDVLEILEKVHCSSLLIPFRLPCRVVVPVFRSSETGLPRNRTIGLGFSRGSAQESRG